MFKQKIFQKFEKRIVLIIFLLLNFSSFIFSQIEEMNCLITSEPENPAPFGYKLPSIGTINVLIVFAQFSDDNYEPYSSVWLIDEDPSDMSEWVEQSWNTNPAYGHLTHYFNDMSWNPAASTARLKFIGKEVSVIAPHSRQWYLSQNWKRWAIHKEILQQLDASLDFGEFDNWDADLDNNPDGKVDFIIFIWRNIACELPNRDAVGIALNLDGDYGSLGVENNPGYFEVDSGQRRIYANDWGSGVTVRDYVEDYLHGTGRRTFQRTVHEFAHYLLGHNNYHSGFGFWGMLAGFGIRSQMANSFEKERLGWLNNLTTITCNQTITLSDQTLTDYITTGVSYKLDIDNETGQYFYIENHQCLSVWENDLALYNIEPGLYVLRKDNVPPSGSGWVSEYFRMIPADGRFDWTVNQKVQSPWGPELLPVFKNLGTNRENGYHDLQHIPWTWNGVPQAAAPIHFTENESGDPVIDARYQGDGKDAFRIGYNEVFSPWSNPNSYKVNRTATPFGFKINSLINGIYSIDIYVNTSQNGPPSKPQNLKVSGNDYDEAVLTWDANTETDIISGGHYKIFRADVWGTGEPTWEWELAATINAYDGSTPITTWTDTESYLYSGPRWLHYKISALDNTSQESVPSDKVKINGKIPKQYLYDKSSIVYEYKLLQNNPNPFNPSTQIIYSVLEDGLVTLKVFDILGREVTALVNEEKPAGTYTVNFDGSNLSSGIYFYSISAGKFNQVKKMVLAK